jgi:hypothetical protein
MPVISVIVGSTREGRFSEKPAKWVLQHLKNREGIDARLLDLREFPMPFFDQPATGRRLRAVHRLRDRGGGGQHLLRALVSLRLYRDLGVGLLAVPAREQDPVAARPPAYLFGLVAFRIADAAVGCERSHGSVIPTLVAPS